MLAILEKIYRDECEYLSWEEFERLSNWIGNTVDSTTEKAGRANTVKLTFANIGFTGMSYAKAMLNLFNEQPLIKFSLSGELSLDEERAAKYIKQMLMFYGAAAALYNKYYDTITDFVYRDSTYYLILDEFNIHGWKNNSDVVMIFKFRYGNNPHLIRKEIQLNISADNPDSLIGVPASLNAFQTTICSWLDRRRINFSRDVTLSELNMDLFKECIAYTFDNAMTY